MMRVSRAAFVLFVFAVLLTGASSAIEAAYGHRWWLVSLLIGMVVATAVAGVVLIGSDRPARLDTNGAALDAHDQAAEAVAREWLATPTIEVQVLGLPGGEYRQVFTEHAIRTIIRAGRSPRAYSPWAAGRDGWVTLCKGDGAMVLVREVPR